MELNDGAVPIEADPPSAEDDRRRTLERAFIDDLDRRLAALQGPVIVFGIPLRARPDPAKWEIVQRNLRATLANLGRQRDANFVVVVAGHDRPALGGFDSRICWIEANWEPPDGPHRYSHDKVKKRRLLLSLIRRSTLKEFYFFTLDADDYLDPQLCEYIRSDHNRVGYYIDKGYLYDVSAGILAEMSAERTPFYKHCGSCAAFWLTTNDLPRRATDTSTIWTEMSNKHISIPETMVSLGRPMGSLPFPAGLYFVNHGASNVQEKDRVKDGEVLQRLSEHKTIVARRTRIASATRVQNILKRFGVRTLPSGGLAAAEPGPPQPTAPDTP